MQQSDHHISPTAPKILLVDDHAIVRAGIRQLLEESDEVNVVSEADSGNQALKAIRERPIDIVLLDIALPGKSGLETLKQIRKEKPGIKVVILSMYPEEQYAVRTFKAGASGYLTKRCAPTQLLNAIYTVHNGERYISPSCADILATYLTSSNTTKEPHERLTDREYQIFQHMASGKSVSTIAQLLNISVKTVSTHRTNILAKLALRNNSELMHYAIARGLTADTAFL